MTADAVKRIMSGSSVTTLNKADDSIVVSDGLFVIDDALRLNFEYAAEGLSEMSEKAKMLQSTDGAPNLLAVYDPLMLRNFRLTMEDNSIVARGLKLATEMTGQSEKNIKRSLGMMVFAGWRGTNVTRIENLSDIAFAIALGMLVTGVDAPRSLMDLRGFLINIIPTFLAFCVLLGLWNGHYTFFRRYGVADRKIIILNAVLIFIVLFMAYPLRFAFDALFGFLTTVFTDDYSRSVNLGVMSIKNAAEIIVYFCLFYSAAFATFAMMQGHVLKKAEPLNLNEHEIAISRQMRLTRWLQCGVTLFCAALAGLTPLGPAAAFFITTFKPVTWIAKKRYPTPGSA